MQRLSNYMESSPFLTPPAPSQSQPDEGLAGSAAGDARGGLVAPILHDANSDADRLAALVFCDTLGDLALME